MTATRGSADGKETTDAAVEKELAAAERRAWDALARYKFLMFGYWCAVWVHLARLKAGTPVEPMARAGSDGAYQGRRKPRKGRRRTNAGKETRTMNAENTGPRFPVADHDEENPLEAGKHTGIGRVVPPWDDAWKTIQQALEARGEALWYGPVASEVETTGTLVMLDAAEQAALGAEGEGITAAVEWFGFDTESLEGESGIQLLTTDEHARIRRETLSAVINDVIAADDRESTGRPRDGESLEDAARRLVALMRERT